MVFSSSFSRVAVRWVCIKPPPCRPGKRSGKSTKLLTGSWSWLCVWGALSPPSGQCGVRADASRGDQATWGPQGYTVFSDGTVSHIRCCCSQRIWNCRAPHSCILREFRDKLAHKLHLRGEKIEADWWSALYLATQ